MAERGVMWSEAEVKLLLSIWGEEGIQNKLCGTKRNQRVFEIISERMRAAGVVRSAVQCRVKLKALKLEYKKVVDNNRRSGRGKKTFKYFYELDRVLGDNPACRPEYTFDSTEPGLFEDVLSSDHEESMAQDCSSSNASLEEDSEMTTANRTPTPTYTPRQTGPSATQTREHESGKHVL
nr:zinc finger and SCAN domain-containing protein 20-like [Misgurnus anguillicaudatus]